MSWGLNVTKVAASEFDAAVDALELSVGFGSDFAREEAEAQVVAAKAAAKAIFASGAVGTEGEYTANLNGHAEPGHARRAGYSGDTVTVTVQRYIDYSSARS